MLKVLIEAGKERMPFLSEGGGGAYLFGFNSRWALTFWTSPLQYLPPYNVSVVAVFMMIFNHSMIVADEMKAVSRVNVFLSSFTNQCTLSQLYQKNCALTVIDTQLFILLCFCRNNFNIINKRLLHMIIAKIYYNGDIFTLLTQHYPMHNLV